MRRPVLVLVAAAAACLICAGSAQALVYCVPSTSIANNCQIAEATLAKALDDAAYNVNIGNTDNTVKVQDGATYPGPFAYPPPPPQNQTVSTRSVHVVVAGGGTATVTFSGDNAVGFDLEGNPASTISGLTIRATAGANVTGLKLVGTSADHVAVDTTATGQAATGVGLDGASLTSSTVTVGGPTTSAAIQSTQSASSPNAVAIYDDTLSGPLGVVQNIGTVHMQRDIVHAGYRGVDCLAADCYVSSSLIVTSAAASAGVHAACLSFLTPASAHVYLGNLTVYGPATAAVQADGCNSTSYRTQVLVGSSILWGATHAFYEPANDLSTVVTIASYDDYDPSTNSIAPPNGFGDFGGSVNHDPGFLNAASGDFHIAYGPLVDAGSQSTLDTSWESSTDLDGRARAQSKPGVTPRRDIGAYEYRWLAPTATFGLGQAGATISVDGTGSSDPDPGETQSLTYTWDFGDGHTGSGSMAAHTYTAAGQYTVTLTVTDVSGLSSTPISQSGILVTDADLGGNHGGGGGPGAPALTGLTQTHMTWRLGGALPHLARAAKPPVGTSFGFTLSAAATVRFQFTRLAPGRMVGHGCRPPSHANRHKPACTRQLAAGGFSLPSGAGHHTVGFAGRLSSSSKLAPGRYSVAVTATNSHGHSQPRTLSFTIVS